MYVCVCVCVCVCVRTKCDIHPTTQHPNRAKPSPKPSPEARKCCLANVKCAAPTKIYFQADLHNHQMLCSLLRNANSIPQPDTQTKPNQPPNQPQTNLVCVNEFIIIINENNAVPIFEQYAAGASKPTQTNPQTNPQNHQMLCSLIRNARLRWPRCALLKF